MGRKKKYDGRIATSFRLPAEVLDGLQKAQIKCQIEGEPVSQNTIVVHVLEQWIEANKDAWENVPFPEKRKAKIQSASNPN